MKFNASQDTKKDFTKIRLRLSSSESILSKSRGEVLKPETINYRSYKPEKDGLFCEKIFGPVKDWECHCGKYKRIRYKGIVCDRCGVEVTRKKVRRERMGHITLAVPVAHIWYLKSIPSKLANVLGMSAKSIEQVIYYESYIVIQPGKAVIETEKGKFHPVEPMELIDEDIYLDLQYKYGEEAEEEIPEEDLFIAKTGAEALYDILVNLDIPTLIETLKKELKKSNSASEQQDIVKRLKILNAFHSEDDEPPVNRPEYMILKVLPVIPPELRPLVPLEGGRFAASDLNDLYRRVIIRNNRLKQLIDIKAPDVILRNEKRMLQEAVDSLFDNSRRRTAVRSGTRRPLKSLSDMLNGKEGRFRQNLLGKRVDYSGRSVIVVGPELKIHECGLPKLMATELFKPHLIHELLVRGKASTPKTAKSMVERRAPEVMDLLEYVVKDHPVLLNRAPTLHRLGIQAFQPILVDGKAIRVHPLVCAAFNADFDGDQMAVHIPLSFEAQIESRMLMLSSNNILHPAHGNPISVPSQDMVLGAYYITRAKSNQKGEGMVFSSYDEALLAFENNRVTLHSKVKLLINGKLNDTTVGRIYFNAIVPNGLPYYNELITKKRLENIIAESNREVGLHETVRFLDALKDLGFELATMSGVSIGLSDVLIPDDKFEIIRKTQKLVDSINEKRNKGVLTENERYNKVIDAWSRATDMVQASMNKILENDREGFNPIYMMSDSGARGSKDQMKQLAGMRGLMNKPQKSMTGGVGEIIETPITSNFKEGLTVLEYFISTHGARKGLSDTALKTADAGYLTRRLVDVAQDVVISEEDCGSINGIEVVAIKDGEQVIEPLSERILGRVALDDIVDPVTDKLLVESGELIDEEKARIVDESNVETVMIRSVLTCESKSGVCAACYGRNLATSTLVNQGEAIGIVAAQSIGEPGTQLTLRTFHIGGTASHVVEESHQLSRYEGQVVFSENLHISNKDFVDEITKQKYRVVLARNGKLSIIDNNNRELISYTVPEGAKIYVKDGQQVDRTTILYDWDVYNEHIVSRYEGYVKFIDLIPRVTYDEVADTTGFKEWQIIPSKDRDKTPRILIVDEEGNPVGKAINLPESSSLLVKEGQKVYQGETLAKRSKETTRSNDITGGLPRVSELFEARNPSNEAIVSEVNGYIQFDRLSKGVQTVRVRNDLGEVFTYKIPPGKHILVHDGDYVHAGDPLCDGAIPPKKILKIKGVYEVQKYLVNEIQHVYRLQGVRINDKHIEVIVRQMLQKVEISDPGDTEFLIGDRASRQVVMEENEKIMNRVRITDSGDTAFKVDNLYPLDIVEEDNIRHRAAGKKPADYEPAVPATFEPLLLGITRASLNTESWISAASFQETTRVLTDAAIEGKIDYLKGLKENIIMGRLIPAGTGQSKYKNLKVSEPEFTEVDDLEYFAEEQIYDENEDLIHE
ncbi:MAG: DNA-directed RNA polymerase subunit beta' [Candidatus Marinimicrobia bacterium]|nr:DNA-directed RNA polymerase subunit beta' [Candidatus Neomarinimicrobiota bacterium]